MFTRNHAGFQARPQDGKLAFKGAAIDKFEQTQACVVRDGQHRAKRCLDSFGKEAALPFRCARRFAKDFGKGVAKSALRFEAAPVADSFHTLALVHFAQSPAHPAGAIVSLESHAVMPFELAARGRRIDRKRSRVPYL